VSRPADSVAARVARHRASGVRVDAVLRDPAVIDAWRRLLAGRTVPEALAYLITLADQPRTDEKALASGKPWGGRHGPA
jgi:hypothetical protein